MKLRDSLLRLMAERQLTWTGVARQAGKAPKSLHIIRDGGEDGVEWETVRAIVEGLGLSYSEFFADSPRGWRGKLAGALAALPHEDLDLLRDTLLRLAASRSAKERDQLQAVAEAIRHRRDT